MKLHNGIPLLALSFFATACVDEPVLGPDVGAPSFSVHNGHGPVVQSVTGFGLFTQVGEPTTFSFTARRYEDGSVKGEWERQNRSGGFRAHGDVTCFTIVGNLAYIGGIIEQFPSDPGRVGNEAVWFVVDNGQGANAPPDLISQARGPGQVGRSSASDFCSRPRAIFTRQVEAGNISVRG